MVTAWLVAIVLIELEGRLLGGDPLGRRPDPLVGVGEGRARLVLLAIVVLYEVVDSVWIRGTLGKRMLGLRVVDAADLGRIGLATSALRAVVLLGPLAIPYVGGWISLAVALSSTILPDRRGLHDLAAGTVVVEQRA